MYNGIKIDIIIKCQKKIRRRIAEQTAIERDKMLECPKNVYKIYTLRGARSSKKVDCFHKFIADHIKTFIGIDYHVLLEQNVPSYNASGKKRCDIVLYKFGVPYVVFPVKIIMSNYKQNRNNAWENLTGELLHLHWQNPDINIIPINIFMDQTPYLNKLGNITKFETIEQKDIVIYNVLMERGICYNVINYIINVNHNVSIGDKYTTPPNIIGFDLTTPFKKIKSIIGPLL